MKTILIENNKKSFPFNFGYIESNNGSIDNITLYINSIDINRPEYLLKDLHMFRFNIVDKNIIYQKDIHMVIPNKYVKINGKPYKEFFEEKLPKFKMEPEFIMMYVSLVREGESYIVKYLHNKTIYENLVKKFDKEYLYNFEEFDEKTKLFF